MAKDNPSIKYDLSRLAAARVVVVGDCGIDRWIYGRVERISPEAPVPIFIQESIDEMPGMAANVAENLDGLGVRRRLVDWFPGKPIKTRYVVGGQQLLRCDAGDTKIPIDAEDADGIIEKTQKFVAQIDAAVLVISDYAKGVCTPDLCQRLIAWAKANGVKVVVDPKGLHWGKYDGCDVICPNRAEYDAAKYGCHIQMGAILITDGALGMELRVPDNHTKFHAHEVCVKDVCGAGDTVVAALAASLAVGFSLEEAARIANAAAAVVVSKSGTSTASIEEVEAMLARAG